MSTGGVQAIILCEDRQLECFVRKFLVRRNWVRHQIRSVPVPQGKGSGEQWVRERFPVELRAFRSRNSRASTCLIVGADADNLSVEARIKTFQEACDKAEIHFRMKDEAVLFIVPRRNIETWLAFLRGEPVSEEDTYRKYDYQSDCRDDVARLDELCRQQKLEPEPPPSLLAACTEFKRIPN